MLKALPNLAYPKKYLSFYTIVSALAIAILAGLVSEYSARFSPPITLEHADSETVTELSEHVTSAKNGIY